MLQFLHPVIFVMVVFSASGFSELLIAVPQTSQGKQQLFNYFYNRNIPSTQANIAALLNAKLQSQSQNQIQVDPPIPVESKTFDIYQPIQSTNQFQFVASTPQPQFQYVGSGPSSMLSSPSSQQSQTQALLAQLVQGKLQYATPAQAPTQPQYSYSTALSPAEKKSISMLQNFGSSLGFLQDQTQAPVEAGHSSKKGPITITIKLEPDKILNNNQGQGSNLQNSYASLPKSQTNNGIIQLGNSIAQAFSGGSLIAKPNPTVETPVQQGHGFISTVSNLIKSQLSSFMDSSESPQLKSGSQQYAIFAPNPTQASFKQNQMNNIANFLTQGVNSGNNRQMPQVQIAKPISNQVTTGTGSGVTDGEPDDATGPLYNAASTIMKTVSKIPSNLDLMFNDMGRVYRKNLFQLRDTLTDMSLIPSMGESKKKDVNEMWLDAYGA